MAKYVTTLSYQDREILYVNCENADAQGMIDGMDEMLQAVLTSAPGRTVLVLFNMMNTPASLAVSKKGRELVDAARKKGIKDMPTAIVGFTGAQKVITQMFANLRNPDSLLACNTLEEAKEWLIKH